MQRGRDPQVELEIFKTRQKGWGVKSRSSIERGTFIGIYTGELVPERNTDKRGRIYSKVGRTYLFDLDHWHIAKPPVDLAELDPVGGADAHKAATQMETEEIDSFYTVDAFHWGNFTRFINHSCDPNLIMGSVYYDDYDIRKPKLCITARRDIPAGQELCISYMGELDVDEDLTEGIAQTEASPQGKGRDRRLHNPHTGSVHTEKTATGAVSKKYYRCYWLVGNHYYPDNTLQGLTNLS
jgi:histone-lysine N-methyltransferase SUV39H